MTLQGSLALVVAVTGLMLAAPGRAQEFSNPIGAEAYRISCAVCHGTNAQGDGQFAPILTVKPSDLTTLSARNGGVFPYLDVFETVDGRKLPRAHGTSVMPIWGDFFRRAADGTEEGLYGSELSARTRITALVDYIETLQK